jgi:hypothetical protein
VSAGGGPRCWLNEDDSGFWWQHECTPYDEAVLADLGEDDAAWYREQRRAPRLLPTGPNGWTVDQVEPLTLSPSILCGTCKVHGWWRDGEWVSA